MLTQEQALTQFPISCYDGVIIIQLIEKLLRGGLVTGPELTAITSLRIKMVGSIKREIDVDLDRQFEPQSKAETETKDAE